MLVSFKKTYRKCIAVSSKKNAESFIMLDSREIENAVNNHDYFWKVSTVEHVKLKMDDGVAAVANHGGEFIFQVKE